MSQIDMNSIDTLDHATISDLQNDNSIVDREELDEINENIKRQYINFENLGVNLLEDVPVKYKLIIFEEMIDYIQENYVDVVNYDETTISPNKRIQIGNFLYRFFVIDGYNVLLPNFLNSFNCVTIEQFDLHIKNVYNNDASNFKTRFYQTIDDIAQRLLGLRQIDSKIHSDKKYKDLLKTYEYYKEIVNFGDSSNLLFNYIRPMFDKNSSDILWRMY